jgi:hypothetical protein
VKSVPGWQSVDLSANLSLPCAVCRQKPRSMFWKQKDGKSYAVCHEHAVAENDYLKGKK